MDDSFRPSDLHHYYFVAAVVALDEQWTILAKQELSLINGYSHDDSHSIASDVDEHRLAKKIGKWHTFQRQWQLAAVGDTERSRVETQGVGNAVGRILQQQRLVSNNEFVESIFGE